MTIYKHENYKDNTCNLKLDSKRKKDFNEGKEIEVTEAEFNSLGKHRWIAVKEEKKKKG